MRHIALAALILLAAMVGGGVAAEAQQQAGRVVRVGLMFTGYVPRENGAFLDAMRQLGYVEGQNIAYIQRTSTAATAPQVAHELASLRPDVIVTSAPLNVRALEDATSTIPIVFAVTGNAVEDGLVASLAHPGANATGLSFQSADLISKRLELLREAFPNLRKVALFSDPADSPLVREAATKASETLGFELQIVKIPDADALDPAFANVAASHTGAVLVSGGRVITPNSDRFVALAIRHHIPTMCHQGTLTRAGCLLSYGPSFPEMFRRAAVYVDRILKGARASELPVEQPTKFELLVNLKTAGTLGVTLPEALLNRADEVIE